MSKTNKKTQNNQRNGGNQNSRTKKTNKKNLSSKQQQGQKRFGGKQASVAAAYATRSEGKAPKIQASRDTCNIKHREFIGNVSGSVLFQIALSLSVNPGLSATFPWLSIMAQAWEQYKFRKLRFVFLTRTGSNTPGSVIMSPDYDSSDAAPVSEQVMTTYDGTVEDAPWKDNSCNLKVNLLSGAGGPRKFVRTGALSPNQDIKLYDVANMFVGTVDGTAVAWGKLWVEYDIDFWVPQLPPSGQFPIVLGGKINGANTMTAANPFGIAPVVDSLASGLAIDSSSRISLAGPGSYLVDLFHAGTVVTNLAVSNSSDTTVTTLVAPIVNTAGTSLSATYLVVAASAGASFNVVATATTITTSVVYISSVPTGSIN